MRQLIGSPHITRQQRDRRLLLLCVLLAVLFGLIGVGLVVAALAALMQGEAMLVTLTLVLVAVAFFAGGIRDLPRQAVRGRTWCCFSVAAGHPLLLQA